MGAGSRSEPAAALPRWERAGAPVTVALAAAALVWAVSDHPLAGALSAVGVALTLAVIPRRHQAGPVESPPTATEILSSELTRCRRYERPLAVLVCRPVGRPDRLTRGGQRRDRRRPSSELLDEIQLHLRRTDRLAALGGNAVVVIAPDTTGDGAGMVAARLQALCARRLGTAVACGWAAFPADAVTAEGLLQEALATLDRSSDNGPSDPPVAAVDPHARGVEATALSPREPSALEQCPWLRWYPIRIRRRRWLETGVKRALDVAVSLIVLLLTAPLLVLVAIAIKLESRPGPVLFAQWRTGHGARRFRMFKFRTMVPDAEKRKAELLALNARSWPDFKVENDPRVTSVGRLLRATSIDELPQLFNVLRGDMSLVGPRPTSLPPADYELWQLERFDVKPGVTGLWQVIGRDSPSFVGRLRLDLAYLQRESLRLDLSLLLRTVPTLVRRRTVC
jgi:lipopolysaccharide/colanic/teichoic acid biosynthesis glycosyltransferase